MTTDMIVKDLPRVKTGMGPMVKSPVPMTVYYPGSSVYGQIDEKMKEEKRRDDIILKLWRETPLRVGMRVRAKDDAEFKNDGYAVILAICNSYTNYRGNVKHEDILWPESNNPMIVDAKFESSGIVFHATTNYFVPA